jgi:hypothetical protein
MKKTGIFLIYNFLFMKQTNVRNLLFALFFSMSLFGASAQVQEYTLQLRTEGCQGDVYIDFGEPTDLTEIDLALNVYPNPVIDRLNVPIPAGKGADVLLMDVNGKLLQHKTVSKDESLAQLALTNYPAGIYFVQVISTKNTVYKIIKQKL